MDLIIRLKIYNITLRIHANFVALFYIIELHIIINPQGSPSY